MIVDTSVMIDSLRGERTAQVRLLRREQSLGHRVSLLPVVYQEVMQGAKTLDGFERLDRELGRMAMELVPDPVATARLAALIYLQCREAAETIRSAADCLIAASCIHLDLPLLHNDRDFEKIAAVEPLLKIVPIPPP